MIKPRTFATILGIVAIYLLFTQLTANVALMWGFIGGWLILAASLIYRHVNSGTDYRFSSNSMFWVEFFSTTIVVACTFAFAGKILIA